jgi:hypothetical protein
MPPGVLLFHAPYKKAMRLFLFGLLSSFFFSSGIHVTLEIRLHSI